MTRPLLTVIVPGRDVAAYAQEAIDSLRAQTLPEWQAILVDDGSTDDTAVIFAAAAHADPRFRVVTHERPLGLGAARNAALGEADTEFIAFLDADDVMRPRALERAVQTLRRTGSDLVVGAYVRLRPEDGRYVAGDVQPWVAEATDPARDAVTVDEHPAVTGNIVAWSKISRRALWTDAGIRFPEGRLYEDQVVAQRLYAAARAIDVIPDVLVEWRVRADGSSITQREADPAVLADCLDQMTAGLAVLADAHPTAAAARRRVILTMDIPRLAAIAAPHPDPAYRRTLGTFARTIAGEDADVPSAVAEARTW